MEQALKCKTGTCEKKGKICCIDCDAQKGCANKCVFLKYYADREAVIVDPCPHLNESR
jgi:hypothetical protein